MPQCTILAEFLIQSTAKILTIHDEGFTSIIQPGYNLNSEKIVYSTEDNIAFGISTEINLGKEYFQLDVLINTANMVIFPIFELDAFNLLSYDEKACIFPRTSRIIDNSILLFSQTFPVESAQVQESMISQLTIEMQNSKLADAKGIVVQWNGTIALKQTLEALLYSNDRRAGIKALEQNI